MYTNIHTLYNRRTSHHNSRVTYWILSLTSSDNSQLRTHSFPTSISILPPRPPLDRQAAILIRSLQPKVLCSFPAFPTRSSWQSNHTHCMNTEGYLYHYWRQSHLKTQFQLYRLHNYRQKEQENHYDWWIFADLESDILGVFKYVVPVTAWVQQG